MTGMQLLQGFAAAFVLAMAPLSAMAQGMALRHACAADLQQLCAGIQPGEGRLRVRQGALPDVLGALQTSPAERRGCGQSLQGRRTAELRRRAARRRPHPGLHEGAFHRIFRALQASDYHGQIRQPLILAARFRLKRDDRLNGSAAQLVIGAAVAGQPAGQLAVRVGTAGGVNLGDILRILGEFDDQPIR